MLSRWLMPFFVAVIGIAVSFFAAYEADRTQKNLRTSELAASVERWLSVLEFSTEAELALAKNLVLAFEDLPVLDKQAFETLSGNAIKLYSGLDALFWVPALKASQSSVFEQRMQKTYPDFFIKAGSDSPRFSPAPVADYYYPVSFFSGGASNLSYLGWDLGSFAGLSSIFNRLEAQGEEVQIQFVPSLDSVRPARPEDSHWQMLLVTKLNSQVYLPDDSAYKGDGYLVFVVDFSLKFNFFSDMAGGDKINVVVSMGEGDAQQTVFEMNPSSGKLAREYTTYGTFGGRAATYWQVELIPTDKFFFSNASSARIWVLAVGLGITLLLVCYLYVVKRRTALIEERVELRTHELQSANYELDRLSHTDYLTGVANRRYFEERLEQEWSRALRGKYSMTLMMIDVDSFKLYSDRYGHIAGDECLQQVTKALMATVKRPADTVARYGGEEFVLMLPNTDFAVASLAEACRQNVEQLELKHEASEVSEYVTISIGVASMQPELGQPYRVLVKAADNALYRAKKQGKNQVVIAGVLEE